MMRIILFFTFLILYTSSNLAQHQLIPFRKGNEWGYCDIHKSIKIPIKFQYAEKFENGFARVMYKGKYGLINEEGKFIAEPKYDNVYDVIDKLAGIEENLLWGFINTDGKIIVKPKYDQIQSFSEGLAAVRKGGKWGFIDTNGTELIPLIFSKVFSFKYSLAGVFIGNKCGFIETKAE